MWSESFQTELDDALREEIRKAALIGVRASLEEALRQEVSEHLGFGWYERSGSGPKPAEAQRSGYFRRQVNTDHGNIPDLRVPKLRRGNKEREWKVLTRYQSCLQYVLDALLYIYMLGLSLRDLQEALYVLFGPLLSVSAINRVTCKVQETMQEWYQRPIEHTPPIILVDGVWVKILYPTGETWLDRAGHERQERRVEERVILAGLAVWPDGHYHILHYEVAETEDESSWCAFWQHAMARGLAPQAVELVVSAGTKGLLSAMKRHLPKAKLQRCTVHKVRGFAQYLSYRDLPQYDADTGRPLTEAEAKVQRRTQISAEALDIFQASTRVLAEQRLDAFIEKWRPLEPRAVKNFLWGIKRCFEFYAFDEALHPLIRSTNLLERFFREFRAKSDEIGSFPNDISCLTIFYLVMTRDQAKHDRLTFAKT